MVRLPDWEARLNAFLAAHQNAEFKWGTLDCVQFVFLAIEAMTGENPIPAHGNYTTRIGAARALSGAGFDNIKFVMDSVADDNPPAMAMRGDIVMHDGGLGVCIGKTSLFLIEDGVGLRTERTIDCSHSWRVPFEV